MPAPVITLLTDFGLQDPYVGIMKGVILGICPNARLIDLTHEVAPYQISQAAFLLAQSWRFFPVGSIHLVVVDPGVGTTRRPILTTAAGHTFVGPDNGVFSSVSLTGVREIAIFAPLASHTFHGRDIFAPTAAQIANGVPLSEIGPLVTDPVILAPKGPSVLHIDHFGNVITNLRAADHPGPLFLQAGAAHINLRFKTYGDAPAGELFLIEGSSGYLEIALNQASAAQRLSLEIGDPITTLASLKR